MSFPRYPAYKDSGVEWLGEVPRHWGHFRVKHLFAIGRGRVISLEDANETGTYPVYSSQTTNDGCLGYIETFDFDCDQITWTTDGANAGTVFLRRGKHNCTNVCGTLQVKQGVLFDLVYGLNYLTFATPFYKRPDTNGAKIMNGEMAEVAILAPPVAEQTQIAAFLAQETAKIDALVAEQRRLMELLKEKRQAVISHAVTRGLNPNALMKPSGVEWLGDVPAHWELRRVKSVSTFTTSGPRGWSERVGDDGALFVQSGDLNQTLGVDFANSKRVNVTADAEAARTLLNAGDVVVCITGAKTGNVAVCAYVPEAAYINQHLCLIRPNCAVLPVFLGVLLKSNLGQTYFDFSQYGLKQGLSLEDVREAPVVLPPIAEQSEIIRIVEAESTRFDTLTTEAQRAIDLLQERRTALISAAVTGQIDVRNAVTTPK